VKTIKPGAVALLTRTIEFRRRFRFIVTPMLFVSLHGPLRLRSEASLWQFAAEELGPGAALDACMPKVSGEYLLRARACPPGGPAPACRVGVRFAGVEKRLNVFGPRFWEGRGPGERPSLPAPFSDLPLDEALAFGGPGFAENPGGIGLAEPADPNAPWPLPQVETPGDPSLRPGEPIRVGGFGARDITHPQRAAMVGTYDEAWFKEDYPGLARDLDWHHFNLTAPDQWLALPVASDAPFEFEHLHPAKPLLRGQLPGMQARCFVTRIVDDEPRFEEIPTQLETVLFFPHRECAVLIGRGSLEVATEDAAEIKLLLAAADWQGERRKLQHYADAVQQRLEPKTGHFLMVKEDDLLPTGMGERYSVEQFVSAPPADPRPLLSDNLRRRQLAEIESARAMVASHGIDPDDGHAPSVPGPADSLPKKLEDLPAHLAQLQARADAAKASLAATEKQADADRRALFAGLGMDYGVIEREYGATPKGPPTMTAQAQFDTLAQVRGVVAAAHGPVAEIDQYLEDPVFRERAKNAERQSKEAYRASAHLQSPIDPLPADRQKWLRDRTLQHLRVNRSFVGIDLTGANLSGMDFSGCDFSGAHLESVDFSGARLAGARFTRAVLTRANLSRADLTGATLTEANLGEAELADADFSGAVLESAVLRGAHFARARFRDANLRKANLMGGADFREADLSGCDATDLVLLDMDLSGVRFCKTCLDRAAFVRCKLKRTDFGGASLERACFIEVKAVRASFRGARLAKTVFVGENQLDEADFDGADIHTCNFRPASLRGARFEGAHIRECDFSSAQLQRASFAASVVTDCRFVAADLRQANLSGAQLMNSNLSRARLEGADLRECNLYAADLARVAVDSHTRMDGALTDTMRIYPRRTPA